MTRYVWRDGCFRHPQTNEPMSVPDRDGLCMPTVRSDIQDYRSPIDGKLITSRSHQRYDLEKNDCVLSEKPRQKFDREEYKHRKAEQAKQLEARKAI
jgi:hypothetical protein